MKTGGKGGRAEGVKAITTMSKYEQIFLHTGFPMSSLPTACVSCSAVNTVSHVLKVNNAYKVMQTLAKLNMNSELATQFGTR